MSARQRTRAIAIGAILVPAMAVFGIIGADSVAGPEQAERSERPVGSEEVIGELFDRHSERVERLGRATREATIEAEALEAIRALEAAKLELEWKSQERHVEHLRLRGREAAATRLEERMESARRLFEAEPGTEVER